MYENGTKQSSSDIPFSFHDENPLTYAAQLVSELPSTELVGTLQKILSNETALQAKRINLIAAESIASPSVRSLLAHPIGGRSGGGQIGKNNRLFPACEYIDEVESLCYSIYTRLFRAKFCEYRLVSNMNAIALVYFGLTSPGDKIFSMSLPNGGDTSSSPLGPPGIRQLDVFSIPYDVEGQDILWNEFETQARALRPEIVSIARTTCLFPLDLKRIKDIIKAWNGKLFVDAAHEFGLIAGSAFKNPLDEGADLLSGSLGKSFSGPQSGMLLWNDQCYTPKILRTTFPTLVSSYQINRIAAITLAALEMEAYGNSLIEQAILNAKALAHHLSIRGIPVLFESRGFTASHQIILDVGKWGGGRIASHLLSEAGILTNQIIIFKDRVSHLFNPSGIRLGTVLVTRLGMMESEMSFIADCISDGLKGKSEASLIGEQVEKFMESYQTVYYCFEKGLPL